MTLKEAIKTDFKNLFYQKTVTGFEMMLFLFWGIGIGKHSGIMISISIAVYIFFQFWKHNKNI